MGWSLRIKKSISKDSQKNLIFRKGEGGSREKTICRGGLGQLADLRGGLAMGE